MFWSQHLGCWGQNTSRIQNKEVYATLCLQAVGARAPHCIEPGPQLASGGVTDMVAPGAATIPCHAMPTVHAILSHTVHATPCHTLLRVPQALCEHVCIQSAAARLCMSSPHACTRCRCVAGNLGRIPLDCKCRQRKRTVDGVGNTQLAQVGTGQPGTSFQHHGPCTRHRPIVFRPRLRPHRFSHAHTARHGTALSRAVW